MAQKCCVKSGVVQVAVLGDAAVGARVSVWWRQDERYYDGVVESFDKMRQRHTVFYDDGDIELIPLWAPNQMVASCNPPYNMGVVSDASHPYGLRLTHSTLAMQVKVINHPKDWQISAQSLKRKRDEYQLAATAKVHSKEFDCFRHAMSNRFVKPANT